MDTNHRYGIRWRSDGDYIELFVLDAITGLWKSVTQWLIPGTQLG